MHIDAVPNRTSRPTYLLRESHSEGKKARKRTLVNLSALSDEQIEAIRAAFCSLRQDARGRGCLAHAEYTQRSCGPRPFIRAQRTSE
jgi:hypothetical protein